MLDETQPHDAPTGDELAPAAPQFSRGTWYTLPSGRLVQVCKPRLATPGHEHLRYVNENGVMETGSFEVKTDWLTKYGIPLGFSPRN